MSDHHPAMIQLEQQFSFAVETWLFASLFGNEDHISIADIGIEYAFTRYQYEIKTNGGIFPE